MGLNILVAEDNKFTAMQYKIALEKAGHKVTVVKDGDECVQKYISELGKTEFESIGTHPFDLILLDHNMPKKTGSKAAKEILAKKPRQKILFASGYLKSFIGDQTGDSVLDKLEVIEKPFSLSMLIRKITSIEKHNK
jgi:two-component system, cell cycle response regulator CpdR